MKAFDEWLMENQEHYLLKDLGKHAARMGGKATLKWMLKRLEVNYPEDFDVMDITKDIRKELEE